MLPTTEEDMLVNILLFTSYTFTGSIVHLGIESTKRSLLSYVYTLKPVPLGFYVGGFTMFVIFIRIILPAVNFSVK